MLNKEIPPFNCVFHGYPSRDFQTNITTEDPVEYAKYVDSIRRKRVETPSKPGGKGIRESLPNGAVAYTVIYTGISSPNNNKPNYGAVTIFVSDYMGSSKDGEILTKLNKWFKENILDKYTRDLGNGFRQWTPNAEADLFKSHRLDHQFGASLMNSVVSSFRRTKKEDFSGVSKIQRFDTVTKNIKNSINQSKIAQEKYAQLR